MHLRNLVSQNCFVHQFLKRKNHDKLFKNAQRNNLIELCPSSRLHIHVILNDKYVVDSLGYCRYVTPNGMCAVDESLNLSSILMKSTTVQKLK